MPKADWSISVIDGSVFKELEDFQVQVGDQTILVDNEFFGVQYNPEENYVFEILISGIKECLDEPINNSIEVRNYLTSFEDLFQRIAAATQTLTLNEQTYDKAAYFTADGQVDQDILQKTFEQNAFIIANAKDGNYVFDTKTGISCHSLLNSQKKLRLLAEGIFISNENGLDGKPIWKTGITADNYILSRHAHDIRHQTLSLCKTIQYSIITDIKTILTLHIAAGIQNIENIHSHIKLGSGRLTPRHIQLQALGFCLFKFFFQLTFQCQQLFSAQFLICFHMVTSSFYPC